MKQLHAEVELEVNEADAVVLVMLSFALALGNSFELSIKLSITYKLTK